MFGTTTVAAITGRAINAVNDRANAAEVVALRIVASSEWGSPACRSGGRPVRDEELRQPGTAESNLRSVKHLRLNCKPAVRARAPALRPPKSFVQSLLRRTAAGIAAAFNRRDPFRACGG